MPDLFLIYFIDDTCHIVIQVFFLWMARIIKVSNT